MAVTADIKALYEAGAHFGHKTSRWHPKMAPYIHSKRGDSHIINLETTVAAFDEVLPLVTKTIAAGKKVLFVGTKKQAKDAVRKAAESVDQPFVTERWIGGMLTNAETTRQIRKLRDLESAWRVVTRKALQQARSSAFREEIDLLNLKYGGIKDLSGKPGLVVVLDTLTDINAVREANNLHIPVVGIVDSNTNPDTVTHPIPGNDDALKAIEAYLDLFVAAVRDGVAGADKPEKKAEEKKES